ncbi:uncharacterized protein STEHIDRAFT_169677 [Stereum hirsutum FP-91666 SS1]|uniref:uncharacterized protein n=1 Tax=Stereum hirsutum (strain FP-91666) TaxID=721885 RepID=UPI0004449CA5|nr:uncharacterized protein STEHIDRAFT_169677 [Stereum hirsutum FP-91666 SS1]EIM84777.1 hypothetical protein STEHIDRAFT_169677 [Stereum hirsutum FP-91666 SS1]
MVFDLLPSDVDILFLRPLGFARRVCLEIYGNIDVHLTLVVLAVILVIIAAVLDFIKALILVFSNLAIILILVLIFFLGHLFVLTASLFLLFNVVFFIVILIISFTNSPSLLLLKASSPTFTTTHFLELNTMTSENDNNMIHAPVRSSDVHKVVGLWSSRRLPSVGTPLGRYLPRTAPPNDRPPKTGVGKESCFVRDLGDLDIDNDAFGEFSSWVSDELSNPTMRKVRMIFC